MADRIISPDGKWMWTGSDWIPAPPLSESGVQQTINLKDSAMSGDINITQNSTSDFITGISHLLEGLGIKEPPTLAEVFPNQETDKDEVVDAALIEAAEKMLLSIAEFDEDIISGLTEHLMDMDQSDLVRRCFLRMYNTARIKDEDPLWKATLLILLGIYAEDEWSEQKRCYAESARIRRENNLPMYGFLEKY
mgnify:CR=1 FL=1